MPTPGDFNGQRIDETFGALLKVIDNEQLNTSDWQQLQDGRGNALPMELQIGKIRTTMATTTVSGSHKIVVDTNPDGWKHISVSDFLQYIEDNVALGMLYFEEFRSISTPNATVPAHQWRAIGAETNIDAVFSPKGTGAILARVPDNTAVGGNKRGQYAVDWQLVRNNPAYVAAGDYSVVGGGYNNRTAAPYTTIAGGNDILCNGAYSGVGGGSGIRINGALAAWVGGGIGHIIDLGSQHPVIGGGAYNHISGSYFITVVGGESNYGNSHHGQILGGRFGDTRGIEGYFANGCSAEALGRTQRGEVIVRADTTDDVLRATDVSGGIALSGSKAFVLPANSSIYMKIEGVCRDLANGDSKSFYGKVLVKRVIPGGAITLVGSPILTSDFNDASLATAIANISVNGPTACFTINVQGISGKNLRWAFNLLTIEVTN